MDKLLAGVVSFHKKMGTGGNSDYTPLAEGQSPSTLFFGCSDSRVVPAFLSSASPGALFTVRNVGNLVPPVDAAGSSVGDLSEASAIEYAILQLGVHDIVICGHSGCGAMGAVHDMPPNLPTNLDRWLEFARGSRHAQRFPESLGQGHKPVDVLSQRNVLIQLEALATYPCVKAALSAGEVRLHGWWFDIRNTRVDAYSKEAGAFVAFETAYAERLATLAVT